MPFTIDDLNYDKDSKERMPWEHYLELYAKADPKEIASRLSIPYDEEAKEFTLTFLGSEYKITYPDFQVKHVADEKKCYPLEDMIYAKILTIRFLLNGSASVGTGRFKTYREMPWGEVYLRQFDGRCIKRLAFTYGNRLDDFRRLAYVGITRAKRRLYVTRAAVRAQWVEKGIGHIIYISSNIEW